MAVFLRLKWKVQTALEPLCEEGADGGQGRRTLTETHLPAALVSVFFNHMTAANSALLFTLLISGVVTSRREGG